MDVGEKIKKHLSEIVTERCLFLEKIKFIFNANQPTASTSCGCEIQNASQDIKIAWNIAVNDHNIYCTF